jgi:hypothetical protein
MNAGVLGFFGQLGPTKMLFKLRVSKEIVEMLQINSGSVGALTFVHTSLPPNLDGNICGWSLTQTLIK